MHFGSSHSKSGVDIDDSILSAGSATPAGGSFDFDRRWFNVLWIIISVVLVVLLGRVFFLAVMKHGTYAAIASGNTLQETPIIAPRGKIFSVDGEELVRNEPNYSVIVRVQYLPEEIPDQEITAVAQSINLSREFVRDALHVARENKENAVLKEHLTHEELVTLESAAHVPAYIYLEKNALRVYRDAPFFAHIIGYEGLIKKEEYEEHDGYLLTDRIGKVGLEYEYENVLHGTHGSTRVLQDSRGNEIKILESTPVIPGADLHLTIDAGLQKKLTERLAKELERADTRRAAAIAIDPRDGAVRALVSLPSYDNNAFASGISPSLYSEWVTNSDRPLFDRAISGTYPPGSTVKPVMAVAALEEHVIAPDTQIESRGGLQYGQFFFGDWRAHGFTDIRRAIAVSSDVYFYTVGGGYGNIAGLGIDRMHTWYGRFGYGKKTGIDLPGEARGLNPDAAWKEENIGEPWYIGDTYHSSIGQGFMTATPLQIAYAIAAIANGGTIYTPHLVDDIVYNDGKHETVRPHAQNTEQLADPQTIHIVREGMRATVTEGTARSLQSLPVAAAGKTGTAQFGTGDRVHSWFVSFAPYDNPTLVLLVLVEDQTGKISSATVPVARDVLQWYFGGRPEADNDDTLSAPS